MDKILKLRVIKTSNFPKPTPIHKFFDKPFYLVRSHKEAPSNVVHFRCPQDLSKLEIKQILEKLYFLNVESIHSWNKMGKIQKNQLTGRFMRKEDFKKVIVYLKDMEVPKNLQEI